MRPVERLFFYCHSATIEAYPLANQKKDKYYKSKLMANELLNGDSSVLHCA